MQEVGERHDTESKLLSAPGLGLLTIDQLLPSHFIVNVAKLPVRDVPVAKQKVEDTHDTESK
jgi:hypothetical protein